MLKLATSSTPFDYTAVAFAQPQRNFKAFVSGTPQRFVLCRPSLGFGKILPKCRVSRRESSGKKAVCVKASMGDQEEVKAKVKTRIELQKQCTFGERFCLVGDEQCLGGWNPESAVPMEWSPGDVWITPLLELPAAKKIFFKFIFIDQMGEIQWQPGPDRTFETWVTSAKIIVSQDWDSLSPHSVVEEAFPENKVENQVTVAEIATSLEEENTEDADGNVAVLVPGLLTPFPSESVSTETRTSTEVKTFVFDSGQEQNTATQINDVVPLAKEESSAGARTFVFHDNVKRDEEEETADAKKSSDIKENGDHATSAQINRVEQHSNDVNDRANSSVIESDLEWGRKALYKLIGTLGLRPE